MPAKNTVMEKVRQRALRLKRATPFFMSDFYTLGSTSSVRSAFSQLQKEGVLVRLGLGMYVRPKPLARFPHLILHGTPEEIA